MSVAKSFFDITTGRNHGVIPTSDAIRIVLDSGATLLLDKVPPPDGGKGPLFRAVAARETEADSGGGLAFRATTSVSADRIDRALSALVEKLLTGESGVEVTEWSYAPASEAPCQLAFGQIGVPLFRLGEARNPGESRDDAVARLLLRAVEVARRDQSGCVNAVVVHVADSDMVGVACLPEKPEPPVGATLVERRHVGAPPFADIAWEQIRRRRHGLVRRAIDKLRRDCGLSGVSGSRYGLKLFLVFPDLGEKPVDTCVPLGHTLSWDSDDGSLSEIVDLLADARECAADTRGDFKEPAWLRVRTVQA